MTHSAPQGNWFKQWLIPVTAITGLLLIIFYALGVLGGAEKIAPGTTANSAHLLPQNAAILTVSSETASHSLAWQGTVRSRVLSQVAPKLNARILEVRVHPGDFVHKGDVIAVLDDRDLQAATQAANAGLAAAQAQAAQAEAEAQRFADVLSKQAATPQNYAAMLAQAKAARALANQAASKLQQTQVTQGEYQLRAPFSGVVSERLQEPGAMGAPNVPIISLQQPDDLRLEVAIPNSCTDKVKLGMQVDVRIDAPQMSLKAAVDEISPEVDPLTRTQLVKMRLPATADLHPGQLGWLELSCTEAGQHVLIPKTALVNYGQLQAVQVVVDTHWQIRYVRTGKVFGDRVEILSGLKAGEQLLSQAELQP